MLIAYILTKSRFLKWKIVRNKESGVFKKGGYEYNLDRKCQYQKRVLGVKVVLWSMYFEGNPNPLEFDEEEGVSTVSDIPIDDTALIIRKVLRGVLDVVLVVLVAFTFLMTIVIAWKVFYAG